MFISESRTDFLDAEKVLSEQTHSLNLILGGLTQTVTETSEKLLAKMDTLKATTDATLRDTDVLSDKLDAQRRSIVSLTREHAESLTESVRNLENAGIQVTESLSTRKDSLENMLSNVFERTQVITSVTQSLDTDLRHHCTTVETTLEHITEVLSRGARTTVDSLKEHYDLLHSLANESGTQSHQELAHIREHVMHDINSFFSEALDKFNAVSGSIQDVASTIHNNLEATRLQLEQNLVDLPDASEKTSAAMRRVIGDQIKALDTLNGLVKRANIGSSQVLSETDRDTLSDIALIETSSPPRQPLTRGLSATPGLYSSQERGYGPVRAAQKKENLFPSSMAPMAPPEGVDTRWLSPLLERASSKDKVQPPKSPLPTSEHDVSDGRALRSHLALLNTLARDIPKIVDSKRIDDAWASYYRGEPGTFTEALYTPHGQHVFNDVMRLYQESHDFRETVARYIEEFASLLESSSMDGSPSTRRAYLTSDTGKMYTFLAHLSGRL
jgi:hypothetical protein